MTPVLLEVLDIYVEATSSHQFDGIELTLAAQVRMSMIICGNIVGCITLFAQLASKRPIEHRKKTSKPSMHRIGSKTVSMSSAIISSKLSAISHILSPSSHRRSKHVQWSPNLGNRLPRPRSFTQFRHQSNNDKWKLQTSHIA